MATQRPVTDDFMPGPTDGERARALDAKAAYYKDEEIRIKTYKPRTPGVRHLRRPINDHLYMGRAHIPLTFARKGQHIGGRNNSGQIVVRHRGGGHKRRIRMVDFDRVEGGKFLVERIEHDPGRSAHIALISRPKNFKEMEDDTIQTPVGDGITRVKKLPNDREYSYILASQGMRAGELVESFRQGVPKKLLDELGASADAGLIAAKTAWRGNCLPLHMIPTGTLVHNIGLYKGKGGQICRAAGTHGMVVNKNEHSAKEALFVDVRLQSGEVRRITRDACATIGVSSNPGYSQRQLGKAGRSRWLGIRPTVRGVAMNANEHPHGGGRGKSKGNVCSVSPWGQLVRENFFFLCNFRNPLSVCKNKSFTANLPILLSAFRPNVDIKPEPAKR